MDALFDKEAVIKYWFLESGENVITSENYLPDIKKKKN